MPFGASLKALPAALLAATLLLPGGAGAQGRFEPVIRVNDKAITAYEFEQRQLLLRALGAPGDLADEARDRLIDERLQVQAAEELGIEATEEGIRGGVEEYAQRANTDADTFLGVIARNGVAQQSFLDFVEAGVLWREVVRTRFGPRAQVSEDEVDRAIALAGTSGGARALVSEVILPARTPEELAAAEARAAEISRITSFEGFAAAARNFSAAPTAARGGRLDWLPLSELPPVLQTSFLTLPPGGVTEPLRLPNAVAVFQLRALEELPPQRPDVVGVDYAMFLVPGTDPGDATTVAARIDTCDDLYGIAQGLPEERLLRETVPPSELPRDVAAELERLDENEVSTALRRGNAQAVLMLCGRTTEQNEGLDRGEVRASLVNQRLASYAEAYLAELRADAVIVEAE